MKKIITILCLALSWTVYGQIQQNINKINDTVSNPINDIDSIRFNSGTSEMEIILNNGNTESHSISTIYNVNFSEALTSPTAVSATASPNPICEGNSLTLTGNATGATSWSWTGPNGYTSTLQSPTLSNITSADAGVYTLTASNANGDATPVSTLAVIVNTVPTGVTATAIPTPLCVGDVLTLVGGATGATSWSWTGPNGYTSTFQSPTISNSTTADAGVYTLTASNVCGDAVAVNTAPITVNTVPTAVVASATPNPLCAGDALTLTGGATGATSWSWTGPNGYTSNLQSPTLSNSTAADAGVYTLTASNTCGNATAESTAPVTVNAVKPTAVSASATPNPLCAGDALTLVGGATGAISWNWTGPNGFTSNVQSPTISNITPADAGVYTLTASNACGDATPVITATVIVNTVPTTVVASATPNPLCAGDELTLVGGATGATSWSWTGPNGYTSNVQSPSISSITTTGAGIYTLTASNACGNATAESTATVTVNAVPTTVNTLPGSNISATAFVANWSAVSGATNYYIDVSDDANFTNLIVNNQSVGNLTTYNVTSLTCETGYYFRIRAENACGTSASSSSEMVTTGSCPFTCGSPFTDARDGTTYGTVEIGNQCWMSRNLNYIPSSGNTWCYDNVQGGCNAYGALYDWHTATNDSSSNTNPSGIQGVCPTGWHLPSDAEWKELELNLGMTPVEVGNTGYRGTNQGGQLKAASPDWNGSNTSGFTGLPGGYEYNGNFFYDETEGQWWSATENGTKAWDRSVSSSKSSIYRSTTYKIVGSSVRCIKN